MAWQEIKTELAAMPSAGKGPSVKITARGLTITFGPSDRAAAGWTESSKLAFLLGGGSDHGRIALKPDERGAIKPATKQFRSTTKGWHVVVGRFPQLAAKVERKSTRCECEHRPGGMVLVTLPDGWIAAPVSTVTATPASPQPQAPNNERPIARPPAFAARR